MAGVVMTHSPYLLEEIEATVRARPGISQVQLFGLTAFTDRPEFDAAIAALLERGVIVERNGGYDAA